MNLPLEPDPETLAMLRPGRLYVLALEPMRAAVSIYDGAKTFLQQLDTVTRAQGGLLAASWCQSEVCNGGFHQFFQNPTGVLAPEAAAGFDFLDLPSAARIVRRATDMFGARYPREQPERVAALRRLELPGASRKEWDPFSALDREFYAVAGTRAFGLHADAFVRAHFELFFRAGDRIG